MGKISGFGMRTALPIDFNAALKRGKTKTKRKRITAKIARADQRPDTTFRDRIMRERQSTNIEDRRAESRKVEPKTFTQKIVDIFSLFFDNPW